VTKLEVGYLVWGVFGLCLFIPDALRTSGRASRRSREQLGPRRTSRRAGRWRPWSSSPGSRSSPSTSSSTPGPT